MKRFRLTFGFQLDFCASLFLSCQMVKFLNFFQFKESLPSCTFSIHFIFSLFMFRIPYLWKREGNKIPNNSNELHYIENILILLCRTHYIEFLATLIRKNKIDPVVIFDLAEILQEFRRRGKSLPIRPANTFEHEYRRQCMQVRKQFSDFKPRSILTFVHVCDW